MKRFFTGDRWKETPLPLSLGLLLEQPTTTRVTVALRTYRRLQYKDNTREIGGHNDVTLSSQAFKIAAKMMGVKRDVLLLCARIRQIDGKRTAKICYLGFLACEEMELCSPLSHAIHQHSSQAGRPTTEL